jgi:predicted regulator of Ras-like GTPase activity (Roadblock/LC7/MglB family)
MILPSILDEMSEIRAALTADARGRLKAATSPEQAERNAAAMAAALGELAAAGSAVGLARLELLLVKGATHATVTAARDDELLSVEVDPAKGTGHVEKVLHAWATGAPVPTAAPSSARAVPAATKGPPRTAGAGGRQTPPPVPAARAAPAAPARDAFEGDPWAGLRHALLRGLLTEAATRRRAIAEAPAANARAGAEPLPAAELDRAMQALLQGIGSVLAGDGVGGSRTLEPLAGTAQRNLSLRWLALYWSGRGALRSGISAAARTHLTQALLLAKQLDAAAVAASQWVAAEVLAHDADHGRALACLGAARAGFGKLEDRWGVGRTWLVEARVVAAQGKDEAAVAAAQEAWATDAAWEEPAVFLARRALQRGDLGEAEATLRQVSGPASERVRAVIEAIRQRHVTQADAGEFLRESDAAPSARSIRALERIAQDAPRFVQAREALAWMLLKLGKYSEASTIFRGLVAQPLAAPDRASVMLGLGCIAHAQQSGKDPDARLQAAVMAGANLSPPSPPLHGVEGGAWGGEADVVPLPLPHLSTTSLPARSSQMGGAASVFQGQLSVFALPDVIEFVRSARRTGVLVCSSERGMAAMQFRDGRITGATLPGAPDVGELLVRARKLSTVALRAVRTAQPADAPDHVIADRIVKEGLADEAAVRDALRRKVEGAIYEVLRWNGGEFAFNRDADAAPAAAQSQVEFDAQDVLLNVLKQMDEDARARSAPGVPR